MKVRLEVTKANKRLHQGMYEIDDSQTFGTAFGDVWVKVCEGCMAEAPSVGALMDTMHEGMIDQLNGATISLVRV